MQSFSTRIMRQPTAYDLAVAEEIHRSFVDMGSEVVGLMAASAGCSPYLKNLILREGDWLRQALSVAPEIARDGVFEDICKAPPDQIATILRIAKGRLALLVALCDLGGIWALEEVTDALTSLADIAVSRVIQHLVAKEIHRGKLPGAHQDDADCAGGMVVLAMGKMGARELNYSSDIDLICLFDETRYQGVEQEARASFIRVVREMTGLLSDMTAEGYVFRTDLRLRPDAGVTPVCMSMAAAERYYESLGRTWERAAYIKARPCAGDIEAGNRFLKTLSPFVWRRHLDFAAIQDAHDMRLRVRDHRRLHGEVKVEGHDLKLGIGGIREIEFFAQTRQLIAGGRDPDLRKRSTVAALSSLAEKDWITVDVASELTSLYHYHREIEHRLQMVNDAQTHCLPTTADGVTRIAAFCGQPKNAFRAQFMKALSRVELLVEPLFAASDKEDDPYDTSEAGLSDAAWKVILSWHRYPALRSERARTIFQRVQPRMIKQLAHAANPEEAVIALDGFMAGLPAGVQIFSLFQANPVLVDLIVDIASLSPHLALYLSHNASVLDSVIGGNFWQPWPDRDIFYRELSGLLATAQDYETALGVARRWMKEWHFRVGVHHLRGLIGPFEAAKSYADLAEVIIVALWPVVVQMFSRRHGSPPGRGAVVIAMGGLGAARLNSASDVDLVVVYDAAGVEWSIGDKPLTTRSYYARLTQAMVTALSAQTAEGKLYEVDMRLRPSGRQGPVATSIQGFMDYHRNEAWTWEHLALTRARVLVGDATLADEVEAFRRDLLKQKASGKEMRDTIRADVAVMRDKLSLAKPASNIWDVKNGAGRLMEIELCVQMLAMLAVSPARSVGEQVLAGVKAGFLSQEQAQVLLEGYWTFWSLYCSSRLLAEQSFDLLKVGKAARAFILREMKVSAPDDLRISLEQTLTRVHAEIRNLFANDGFC